MNSHDYKQANLLKFKSDEMQKSHVNKQKKVDLLYRGT